MQTKTLRRRVLEGKLLDENSMPIYTEAALEARRALRARRHSAKRMRKLHDARAPLHR